MISEGPLILLVENVDNPVGYVYLKKERKTAYLGMLTISSQLQASGLGRRTLSNAENYVARGWCAQKMRMTVIFVREELISWYERRGYSRAGQTQSPFLMAACALVCRNVKTWDL